MFSSWCTWFEMLSHGISMSCIWILKGRSLYGTCAQVTSAQNFHELHFGMFARLPETAVNGALIFVGLKAALGTQLWEPWHSAFIAFDLVIVYCKCWCVITFIKRTHSNPNINWYSIDILYHVYSSMYWHTLVVLLEVDLRITFIYNALQPKIKALNYTIQVTLWLSGLFLVDYFLG